MAISSAGVSIFSAFVFTLELSSFSAESADSLESAIFVSIMSSTCLSSFDELPLGAVGSPLRVLSTSGSSMGSFCSAVASSEMEEFSI